MGNLAQALKYLRDNPVKKGDSAESAARSDRMNAIASAILALARGDHMRRGPGIFMKTGEGMVIISSRAEGDGGGGGVEFPFEIITGTIGEGPGIGLIPGRVCLIIPTIEGVALTNDPPPLFAPDDGDFSVFLKVNIDQTEEENNHRSGVASATVVTDNDPGVIGDIGESGEVDELIVKWTNDAHSIGHFYIKVGDVSYAVPVGSPPGTPAALTIEAQYLQRSIETIVVAGDDAIVLTGL